MSGTTPAGARAGRFPGFDVLDQREHWDGVTAGVVLARIGRAPDIRFFTPAEQAAGTALCGLLLDLDRDEEPVAVLNHVDARLAEQQTDGWRYEDMPEDGEAWRASLAALDDEARERGGDTFATSDASLQRAIVQQVQDLGEEPWHGLQARHVWSLWTRYACTAFYAHPRAWNEIGFPGPAYPRGYKNRGVDALEPFEVPDADPADDPVHRRSGAEGGGR